MPTLLFRWALPHSGPCTHLTGFEYRLRILVFGTVWVVSVLPTALAALFVAFGAIPALAMAIGFSGVMNGRSIAIIQDELIVIGMALAVCLIGYLFSRFVRHRYLTAR